MNNHPTSKVILITGCSSGFGLLSAARLAASVHHVIATMRNLSKKESLLKEVQKRGGSVDLLSLDVTDVDSIKNVTEFINKKYGRIDVLVNNAGYGIGGFFEDLTQEEIRQQMETNFFGVQNVTRSVLPLMRQQKEGRIINISSISGFYASPSFGAYCASKWALEGFSESLYYEVRSFGIYVTLIEPGTYKTNIFHQNACYAKNFDNPQSPYFDSSQAVRARVMEYVNQCKKNPEDIAQLIEKLIHHKNPPLRVIPDFSSRIHFLLRKFLPFSLYALIFRIIYKEFAEKQNFR